MPTVAKHAITALLLGIAMNAAAWVVLGTASKAEPPTQDTWGVAGRTQWHVTVHTRPGREMVEWHEYGRAPSDPNDPPDIPSESDDPPLLPSWLPERDPIAQLSTESSRDRVFMAVGFPCLVAWCTVGEQSWYADMGNISRASGALVVGIESPPLPPRLLPLRPLWGGIVLNTFFYTSLSALLLWLYLWFGRQRRLMRGFCPRCRYDLRGNFSCPCTECGWDGICGRLTHRSCRHARGYIGTDAHASAARACGIAHGR
jgi:hypothetical protein